jgi:hypothetical protein
LADRAARGGVTQTMLAMVKLEVLAGFCQQACRRFWPPDTRLRQLSILPLEFLVENTVRAWRQCARTAFVAHAHLDLNPTLNVALVACLSEGYLRELPIYLSFGAEIAGGLAVFIRQP